MPSMIVTLCQSSTYITNKKWKNGFQWTASSVSASTRNYVVMPSPVMMLLYQCHGASNDKNNVNHPCGLVIKIR